MIDPSFSALTVDDFFRDQPQARRLFDALCSLIAEIGPAEVAVTKSQIAFRRARPFAWAWRPGQYLRGRRVAPLVLTLSLAQRNGSPRWKQIVEPARGRFIHHLELTAADELDDEVRAWLRTAWELAG